MSNKEKIIDLFYSEHSKPVDISLKLCVSNAYVSKVIKKDFRYYEEMLEMLENKKSLFKPLNKGFIKIKCCEFCRTFCRTTKFFKIKTSSIILRNT